MTYEVQYHYARLSFTYGTLADGSDALPPRTSLMAAVMDAEFLERAGTAIHFAVVSQRGVQPA